jgi:hypothetical protein
MPRPGREYVSATIAGLVASASLAALIIFGSRNLDQFDAALVGHTFATLFATFGITYRYAMWLQRPPTRMYWRRGWQEFLTPRFVGGRGDLVRAYVVNVGPGTSAIHVMGTVVDTVTDGASVIRDVQTYGVPAGSGAIVEFRIPEPGMYGLVDHDRLGYLPYGMVIPFCHAGSRRERHEVNAIRRRRPSPPDVYFAWAWM